MKCPRGHSLTTPYEEKSGECGTCGYLRMGEVQRQWVSKILKEREDGLNTLQHR